MGDFDDLRESCRLNPNRSFSASTVIPLVDEIEKLRGTVAGLEKKLAYARRGREEFRRQAAEAAVAEPPYVQDTASCKACAGGEKTNA
jgi:hypothetical protein